MLREIETETYRDADELRRVDGGVDLVGRLLVVVREVLQALALLAQLLHRLIKCCNGSNRAMIFHIFLYFRANKLTIIRISIHRENSPNATDQTAS